MTDTQGGRAMSRTLHYDKKPFVSSIPLWIRDDQPRQRGMNYWKGPHSGIISATPGFEEYRQIHLAEANSGLWPETAGVETAIPPDRRIDGVAEVTFKTVVSPLWGRKQTKLAYADEVNVFRRTLLYAGPPHSARWYDVADRPGARAMLYLRRKDGVSTGVFRRHFHDRFVPAVAAAVALKELRTQVFMPWRESLWNTPDVAHDNPVDQQFHASLILGFDDADARAAFFAATAPKLSDGLAEFVSAVHAYDVTDALTYVKHGGILPHYER
jgi:hypothetical protein